MDKKKILKTLPAILTVTVLAVSVYAYQVDSTGEKNLGDTSMYGYLYKNGDYSFSAETKINSNPYEDASLSVSVTVVPYNEEDFETVTKSASTTHSTKIAVTSPTASTINAQSASGSHSATIYNGTQSWGNSGSTSWTK